MIRTRKLLAVLTAFLSLATIPTLAQDKPAGDKTKPTDKKDTPKKDDKSSKITTSTLTRVCLRFS